MQIAVSLRPELSTRQAQSSRQVGRCSNHRKSDIGHTSVTLECHPALGTSDQKMLGSTYGLQESFKQQVMIIVTNIY